MAAQQLPALLEKFLQNRIEKEELLALKALLHPAAEEEVLAQLAHLIAAEPAAQHDPAEEMDRVVRRVLGIDQDIPELPMHPSYRPVHRLRRWHWAAAAVLLFCVATFFWLSNAREKPSEQISGTSFDVPPGHDGAWLTLSDGSRVLLDSLQNGVVALQGGAKAILKEGVLRYENNGTEVLYNTITTPKGRQYQVVLSDGTIVWLNAGSSLRYPTVFAGPSRKVEITGEAFFEVRKNTRMPFTVVAANTLEVEVLGTAFNINAYENEGKIDATLISGAVKVNALPVSNGSKIISVQPPLVLKPGQQATLINATQYSAQPKIQLEPEADIDQVLAWKNGVFNFAGADLRLIMRQLERWYDVEVAYASTVPLKNFKGKMPRNASLSEVLTALEFAGLKFKLENKKITVMN